jgi:hypothetical protein
MKYVLALISVVFLSGCVCLNPEHKKLAPPIANTNRVIDSLEQTKDELTKAGDANTIVGTKVERALTLAERLEVILKQIEEEKQTSESKEVKKPN